MKSNVNVGVACFGLPDSEDIENEVGKIFISISGEFLNRMLKIRVCCGFGKVSFPFECIVL